MQSDIITAFEAIWSIIDVGYNTFILEIDLSVWENDSRKDQSITSRLENYSANVCGCEGKNIFARVKVGTKKIWQTRAGIDFQEMGPF